MIRDVEFKMFGKEVSLWDYDIKTAIKVLESLEIEIKKPQILCYSGFETVDFDTEPRDEFNIGLYCIEWIFDHNKTKETEHNIRQCLLDCSVEDEEWTKRRNENYTGIFYRKITFLPEIQDAVIAEITKYISGLKTMLERMNEEKKIKEEKRNKAKAEWRVEKVYKEVKARGGETGVDGYYDAEYISENYETVRMVSRDVFDFGLYSYPKRLEGTDDVFKLEQWTDAEKRADKWIRDFGVLSRKGIRM